MFYVLLYITHSSIAIILMGKRELIALLNLSSWCLVMVERLFLAMPRGCLQFVIVVFPDHTHLQFLVPTFRILTQVVAEKSLTEKNVHMLYIRVKEGKNENLKKEGKMRISILISIYIVHFAYLKVYTKF